MFKRFGGFKFWLLAFSVLVFILSMSGICFADSWDLASVAISSAVSGVILAIFTIGSVVVVALVGLKVAQWVILLVYDQSYTFLELIQLGVYGVDVHNDFSGGSSDTYWDRDGFESKEDYDDYVEREIEHYKDYLVESGQYDRLRKEYGLVVDEGCDCPDYLGDDYDA
ncbi:MAG: hypothetical protein H7844_14355 [Nitrospirae bacterium YQR-1]